MRIATVILAALIVSVMASGCGRGFAAPCSDDFDCRNVCVRGPELPGGFCSAECETASDCPSDGSCVVLNGDFVCLMTCVRCRRVPHEPGRSELQLQSRGHSGGCHRRRLPGRTDLRPCRVRLVRIHAQGLHRPGDLFPLQLAGVGEPLQHRPGRCGPRLPRSGAAEPAVCPSARTRRSRG